MEAIENRMLDYKSVSTREFESTAIKLAIEYDLIVSLQ